MGAVLIPFDRKGSRLPEGILRGCNQTPPETANLVFRPSYQEN